MHSTARDGGTVTYAATGRSGRVVGGGLVLLVSAALTAGALAGGPVAAATAPGAPAMPSALTPGKATAPVFPLRSVPAFAGPTHVSARVRAGDGVIDQRFNVPTPPGSTLLWGDWNRDGAYTPAVFTNGHWVHLRRDGRLRSGAQPRVRLRHGRRQAGRG